MMVDKEKVEEQLLRFLVFRPRATREIRNFGRRKKIPQNLISDFIKKMAKMEYLDDEKFARIWVRDRKKLELLGRSRLARELKEKGITKEMIEKVLQEEYPLQEEKEYAHEFIRKKKRAKLPNLWAALLRRGFSSATIRQLLSSEEDTVSDRFGPEGDDEL